MNNLQILLLISTLLALSNSIVINKRENFLGLDPETELKKDEFLNVHIVPHTHNDAGWLYTAKSYFEGNQRGCVNCILDEVVEALQKNPKRRFVYVEQLFFTEWWNQQSEEKKEDVRQLVQEGRLQFLNGGYVMNDEACTYYDDIIEQMTLGHRFIKSEFNKTVNAGWAIDPFGHSASQARLTSEMGFDSFFIERIDLQDVETREKNQDLEMIWRPKSHDQGKNFVLTHVNYMKYYLAPFNDCISIVCLPSEDATASAAIQYAEWVKNQSSFYPTKHILHQVGGDFEWSRGSESKYQSLEAIMDFFETNPQYGIKAQYSTPSEYTQAVYEEISANGLNLTEKADDFFPYRDEPDAYWTGYFTSKPLLKRTVRKASQYLQSVKKLISKLYFKNQLAFSDFDDATFAFEKALSTLQHHDAVTGTAKCAVDHDYEDIIHQGYDSIHQVLLPKLNELFTEKYQQSIQPFMSNDHIIESSHYLVGGNSSIIAYAYNPSQIQSRVIKFSAPNKDFTLKDELDQEIPYDLICEDDSAIKCKLYFSSQVGTNELKPFLLVSTTDDQKNTIQTEVLPFLQDNSLALFNGETLNIKSGAKDFEYTTSDGSSHSFSLDYGYYASYADDGQKSGAYIFRPSSNLTEYSKIQELSVNKGSQVIEVAINRGIVVTWLRFYNNNVVSPSVEIETKLAPIPVDDQIGKEVVLKIDGTGIDNQGVFYTDANGLESQKRVLNYRETYPIHIEEPVAGNYYPVNSAIYIEDFNTGDRVTLMNDRSQGGSSLTNGSIELMINRRILADDNRGLEEALNSTETVQLKHWLLFSQGPQDQRTLQYASDTPVLVYLSQSLQPLDSLKGAMSSPTEDTDIGSIDAVNLVKFYIRIYSDNEVLVRLHNLQEDSSTTVDFWDKASGSCVALKELLGDSYNQINVKDVSEVTLTTVQAKQDMLKNKYKWDKTYHYEAKEEDFGSISLGPLEERVFILTL